MLVAASLPLFVIGERARRGRLPRNPLAGIRTGVTMRTPEAWQRAHRAAAWHLIGVGLVLAVTGVAVELVPRAAQKPLAAGMVVVVLALALRGTWVAERAATRPDRDGAARP